MPFSSYSIPDKMNDQGRIWCTFMARKFYSIGVHPWRSMFLTGMECLSSQSSCNVWQIVITSLWDLAPFATWFTPKALKTFLWVSKLSMHISHFNTDLHCVSHIKIPHWNQCLPNIGLQSSTTRVLSFKHNKVQIMTCVNAEWIIVTSIELTLKIITGNCWSVCINHDLNACHIHSDFSGHYILSHGDGYWNLALIYTLCIFERICACLR